MDFAIIILDDMQILQYPKSSYQTSVLIDLFKMEDVENANQLSKKRAAGRELNRDNPGLDDEDDTEQETGTFKRAPDEVLATRRIVKVRRNQQSSDSSSNPFAGIQLVPATSTTQSKVTTETQDADQKTVADNVDGKSNSNKSSEAKVEPKANVEAKAEPQAEIWTEAEPKAEVEAEAEAEAESESEDHKQHESRTSEAKAESTSTIDDNSEVKDKNDAASGATKPVTDAEQAAGEDKTENGDEKDNTENVPQNTETTTFNSFQQLSSSQNAFTNLSGTGFSSSTFSFGSIAKDRSTLSPNSGFGLGLSNNNGNSSLFGASGSSIASKSEGSGFPSMHEVSVETGEENEKSVFTAESALFEYIDGGWKERGKGEVKVNVSTTDAAGRARLLMRARGNYRLILNARLYPDMKLTNMDKKGITFACMNSITEGTNGFSTFALKFKDGSIVEDFRAAVTAHKGNYTSTVLKTPENSPKASED